MTVSLSARVRHDPRIRGWIKAIRVMLGLVFLATGSLKLAGHNIRDGFGTPHAVDPVMPLFNAMFAVRPYWLFLGAGQVLAGLLLLTSRTALAGLLVCTPIVANIAVLIFALPFSSADRVAVVMLVGVVSGLLLWEWPRLAPVLAPVERESSVTAAMQDAWARRWVRLLATVGAVAFVGVHVALALRHR